MNRRDLIVIAVLICLADVGAIVFSHHGLLDLRRMSLQMAAARLRVEHVGSQNQKLKQELAALASPGHMEVERQLRENLGWVKPGEIVYLESAPKAN